MTNMLALLAILAQASPTTQPPGRGACAYTSNDPGKKGLTFCTNVATAEACNAEAGRKVPADWVQKHPAKFSPGKDCTASDKRFRKGGKKKPTVRAASSTAKPHE